MSVRSRPGFRATRPFRRFLGVVARQQTYRNLVYLALTFPLGIAYFVLLTTGLSLGFGLLAILVGVPILVAIFLLTDRLLVFERWQARVLLDAEVPLDREAEYEEVWDYLRSPLSDLGTWAGLFYLASKFVLGVATFVVMVLLGVFAGAFILAPLYYESATVQVQLPEPIHLTFQYAVHQVGGVEVITLPVTITSWEVTTLPEALAVSAVGVLLLILSLHVCNLLAKLQGWYARLLIRPRPVRRSRGTPAE